MSGLALVAFLFSATISATPIVDPIEADLQTRQYPNDPQPNQLVYWTELGLSGSWYPVPEADGRYNKGDCYGMIGNVARSARAMRGFKCTIYSDGGCHGWRTKEFTHDGIMDMGSKMNLNGEAFRCCKIGTTNYWGYCNAALNGGT